MLRSVYRITIPKRSRSTERTPIRISLPNDLLFCVKDQNFHSPQALYW
jgi:hypothetical protein